MKRLLAILLITMISYLDASVSNASQTLLSDLSKNTYILRDLKLTSLGTRYLETAHNITTDNIPNNCPINMSGFSRISSYYGMRKHPIFKYIRFHSGIDLAGSYNTEIYATADGVIEKARYYPGYGRMVTVDHGNGIKTLYAHLNKYTVEKGQRVSQGDCIGLLGSSGVSTGPHLHYEIRIHDEPINPLLILFDDGKATQEEIISLFNQKIKSNERLKEYYYNNSRESNNSRRV